MKKKIVILLLISSCIFTACSMEQSNKEGPKAKPKQVESEKTNLDKPMEVLEIYKNKKYGYSIDIPPKWKGKYKVAEDDIRTTFLYTGCPGLKAEFVWITCLTKDEFDQESKEYPLSEEYILGIKGDLIFYYAFPIDVPFLSKEDSDKYSEEYSSLFIQAEEMKRRFHFY